MLLLLDYLIISFYFLFFFFSSRRRHTRFDCDWSSDVCSSDLTVLATGDPGHSYTMLREAILEHGGAMTSVDDGQAFRAMRRVARTEGLSVEPATSVAFAGLDRKSVV